jgi:hypothetical protein
MRKLLLTTAASAALLAGVAIPAASAATSASASTAFKTSTVSTEHPDTTGIVCGSCLPGGNGPIWANDHLKEAVTVTSAGAPNHYNVVITFAGSTFQGFADPRASGEGGSNGSNSGGPLFSQGSIVSSNIHYNDITSTVAPQVLPANLPAGTGLGKTVNNYLFGDGVTSGVTSGPATEYYTFNYKQNAAFDGVDPTGHDLSNPWLAGTTYTQTG